MRRSRLLLKRAKEPFWLWTYLIGAALLFILVVYVLATDWRNVNGLAFLFLFAGGLASLGVVLSIARLLGRKIIFLDEYISFRSWPWPPKVYRYEDVLDIETVKVPSNLELLSQWEFEDNTTVYFADGEKLRIPTSAMPSSKVKKRIEAKTGIKFDSSLKL